MSCPRRPLLINNSITRQDLETQRNVTLEDIRSTLYQQAQVSSQSLGCCMRIATSGAPSWIFLSPDDKIVELNAVDILANYHAFPVSTGRGLYDANIGKIILCRGRWCIETLLHETLHSTCFTSVRRDIARTFLNFYEGLTEFLTGYVMFRHYPDCYLAWKEQRYHECSVTYIPLVKLFATFCRFISMSELLKVYFWNGTTNWEGRCSSLIDAIHQAGYPHFEDFTRRRTPTVEAKFYEECLKNFGRNRFRSIYEGDLVDVLDFANIL